MSISLGVGTAVGVPAALPHDGDPIVPPGEEVVKPSNTFRNFFILGRALEFNQGEGREDEDHSADFVFPELVVFSRMQGPNSFVRRKKDVASGSVEKSLSSSLSLSQVQFKKSQRHLILLLAVAHKGERKDTSEPFFGHSDLRISANVADAGRLSYVRECTDGNYSTSSFIPAT